jgi:tetratricopeptide (TPR) repeat protein
MPKPENRLADCYTQVLRLINRWISGLGIRRFGAVALLLITAMQIGLFAQTNRASAELSQGTEAMREGKLDQAAASFAAAVKREPTFAEAHFNLGLVDEELGNYDEAIVSLRAALRLKPHLWKNLIGGNIFERLHDSAGPANLDLLNSLLVSGCEMHPLVAGG